MSDEQSKPAEAPEPRGAGDTAQPERRPWIPPALEELDLRQAMAVGAAGIFDGTTGSS